MFIELAGLPQPQIDVSLFCHAAFFSNDALPTLHSAAFVQGRDAIR